MADKYAKLIEILLIEDNPADIDLITEGLDAGDGNCYITKPGSLDEFMAAIQSIEEFWLKHVKLPPSESE